jgi:hypothetical protein
MAEAPRPGLLFRRSSRCTSGGCVEVARLPDGGAVVRDTKDRSREPLRFDRQEWNDFVLGVKNGDFDFEHLTSNQAAPPREGLIKSSGSAQSATLV